MRHAGGDLDIHLSGIGTLSSEHRFEPFHTLINSQTVYPSGYTAVMVQESGLEPPTLGSYAVTYLLQDTVNDALPLELLPHIGTVRMNDTVVVIDLPVLSNAPRIVYLCPLKYTSGNCRLCRLRVSPAILVDDTAQCSEDSISMSSQMHIG